jgi:plasmid maintenance system antidote protein VapI
MSKPVPTISDLQADELRDKLRISRSYAFELVNRTRKPSLDMAVRIEREFGVPASAWIDQPPDHAGAQGERAA